MPRRVCGVAPAERSKSVRTLVALLGALEGARAAARAVRVGVGWWLGRI